MTVRAETEITLMRSDDGTTFGSNEITVGTTSIFPFSLAMRTGDDTWESLTTSGGTGTSKSQNTAGFYFDKILYNPNDETYETNETTGRMDVATSIDLRYSTNCGTGLTVGLPVYLVGVIEEELFNLDTTWWTQTEPSAEDDKCYIYLGMARSTSEIYLAEEHTVWVYRDGKFQVLSEANMGYLNETINEGLSFLGNALSDAVADLNESLDTETNERIAADALKVDVGDSGINSLDNNIKFSAAEGLQIFKPVNFGEDDWKVIVASNGVLLALNMSTVAAIQQYGNTSETLMKANNALMSILRFRGANNDGCLGIVAGSDGHVTMKEI